jgi:hypothetical protein
LTKNNSSGFSALPGGSRNYNGTFSNIGIYGHWWSTRLGDALSGSYYSLYYGSVLFTWQGLSGRDLSKALSVRLLKN